MSCHNARGTARDERAKGQEREKKRGEGNEGDKGENRETRKRRRSSAGALRA